MGLISNVFSDEKTVEPVIPPATPTIKSPPKLEPRKEKKYITRVTIEWENRTLNDHVIDMVKDRVYNTDKWKGFFTVVYVDDDLQTRKRIYYPITSIHRIIEEDIEVTGKV